MRRRFRRLEFVLGVRLRQHVYGMGAQASPEETAKREIVRKRPRIAPDLFRVRPGLGVPGSDRALGLEAARFPVEQAPVGTK